MDAKVSVEQWLGMVGRPLKPKSVAAATLSPEKQQEFKEILQSSNISQLPEVPSPPQKTRSGDQRKIIIEQDGTTKTVRIAEDEISPALRRLIDFVESNGS